MAIIGFLFLVLAALYLIFAGLLAIFATYGLSGNYKGILPFLIFMIIGFFVLYFCITHAPFSIQFKG